MKKIILAVSAMIFLLAITTSCYAADNIFKSTASEIDASNSSDGYVKIKYLSATDKSLKVMIDKGSTTYTYDLNGKGNYDAYPLQMGDGSYKIRVLENVSGTKYSVKQTADIAVKLSNANAPFLVPTQMVNYSDTFEAIKKATELSKDKATDLEKVDAIYDYIITNIVYDDDKAATVKSGYLPNIDTTLSTKKGICYDYASLMASMLRAQGIPTKLVTGYSSHLSTFHAWNEIYTDETGWLSLNKFYFDKDTWRLMDSTIASTGKQSGNDNAMEYINSLIDAKNYTKQYEY